MDQQAAEQIKQLFHTDTRKPRHNILYAGVLLSWQKNSGAIPYGPSINTLVATARRT